MLDAERRGLCRNSRTIGASQGDDLRVPTASDRVHMVGPDEPSADDGRTDAPDRHVRRPIMDLFSMRIYKR